MKVILLDYVYKHGVAGEVIDVADGFARNYLIPRGLAVKATDGELRRAAKLREQAVVKRAALDNRLNELARLINGVELIFGRLAASTGKLFGSVTTQEIADELNRLTGVDINRRRISQQPLREVGTHDVPVRLGTEISPVLRVTIVRDEELPAFLAARKAEAQQANAPGEEAENGGEEQVDTANMATEVLPRAAVEEAIQAARAAHGDQPADDTTQDAPEQPE
jgi:large subunit ribosomal protein L9